MPRKREVRVVSVDVIVRDDAVKSKASSVDERAVLQVEGVSEMQNGSMTGGGTGDGGGQEG